MQPEKQGQTPFFSSGWTRKTWSVPVFVGYRRSFEGDLEVAEGVEPQRGSGVHHDRGVRSLDDRRPLDLISADQFLSIEDWCCAVLLQVGPIDIAFSAYCTSSENAKRCRRWAMPSSAMRCSAWVCKEFNTSLILLAGTGEGVISVCSKMWSTSAAAAPKAHQVEAALRCGTITLRTPSSRAKTPACAGPAPPKANSTKSRGSKPFSTVTLRITSAICNSTMRQIPAAHCAASIPKGFASRPMESIAARLFNFIFPPAKLSGSR